MADYYSILKKTVSGLSKNTPEIRAAVYSKARTAIEKQLRELTPAPSEAAIAGQMDALEEAILLLESEHQSVAGAQDAPEADAAPPTPGSSAAAGAGASAIASQEPDPDPAPATSGDVSPPPPPQQPSPAQPVQEPPTATLPPETDTPPPADSGPFAADAGTGPAHTAESAVPTKPPVTPSDPLMDVVSEQQPSPGAAQSHSGVQTTADALDAMSTAVNEGKTSAAPESVTLDDDRETGATERSAPANKGGFGRIGLIALVALLLGGAGYAAWINKDALLESGQELVSASGDGESTDSETADSSSDKEAVRIGENGEDASAGPVDEDSTASGETELPAITTDETDTTEEPDAGEEPAGNEPDIEELAQQEPSTGNDTDGEQPTDTGETDGSDTDTQTGESLEPETPSTADAETPDNENAASNDSQPAIPANGEVAYLYEEGSAGTGATRTNASVNWTVERQQVESGSTQEPVIIGSMQVPEKDLSVRIVIKRNVDEALSASHLIELRFDLPQGFDGQGVEEIARFVMKNTEEARGEALVAVPVKVSEGFFLVALDNLPQAVEVNTQLLEAGGWIDIPVSYSTGRRALLTLEKGTSGRAAFEEAFNDWKNRQ